MYWNCHSHFSFKFGTLSPEALLQHAQSLGCRYLALTDIMNTSGIPDFFRLAPKYGIQPIAGIEFRQGNTLRYIGLAKNLDGFEFLCTMLTHHLHTTDELPPLVPDNPDVHVIYPWREDLPLQLPDNALVGIHPIHLRRLPLRKRPDTHRWVIWQPVTFIHDQDYNAHRLMQAMDQNMVLSRMDTGGLQHHASRMVTLEQLHTHYAGVSGIWEQTQRMLEACRVNFEFGVSKNRNTYLGNAADDYQLLLKLARAGAKERYTVVTPDIEARIQKELDIISEKGFIPYFLISRDIVRYAAHRNFFYVGRGSGANSLIAYCLRITDVDPIDLDLYFERFINLYRENPPDFDLDFSWKDRDEVIQFIFERFGPRHTALLATYSTFQAASSVRELGKVFGLPKRDQEALIRGFETQKAPDRMGAIIYKYSHYLHDKPSHLSIHAGGILISQAPINRWTATHMPPKGFSTTQFSMLEAEDLGLYKFDILSQRGLGHIREAVELVEQNRGVRIDIHDIPRFKADERVRELLRHGRTIGCFYVESPAMRSLLRKLKADDYLTLVAASSIIRPGVSKSGMMRNYIRRHTDPEARNEVHPVMADIMPDTYGVMVYQEDVIKVAHFFGGLDLAQADVLRRGMSGKFRNRESFQQVKDAFFRNCAEKGHHPDLIQEVWSQIESFANYSFAKGHSASFAVESYQSMFLKAYYPLEFMCAVINNFGGFYRTEIYIHAARMNGATVEAPCINRSGQATGIQGKTIWLGLIHIGQLKQGVISTVLTERSVHGPFLGLEDFLRRTGTTLNQVIPLIRIGAFRFTGKSKQELLWDAHFILNGTPLPTVHPELFPSPPAEDPTLPALETSYIDEAFDQFELLGFFLVDPFTLIKRPAGTIHTARDLAQHVGKRVRVLGRLVTTKSARTSQGSTMYFGTFLDEQGQWLDTVHFPPHAQRYPFQGQGIYLMVGKVVNDFGALAVEVETMERVHYIHRDDVPMQPVEAAGTGFRGTK